MTERPSDQSGAEFKAPKTEKEAREKHFELRMHHLIQLRWINTFGPTSLAKMDTEHIVSQHRGSNPDEQKYARDVLSDDIDQKNEYFQGRKAHYEEFFALADDDPVDLIIGQKDGICNLNAVGRHCSALHPPKSIGIDCEVDTVERDNIFMDAFLKIMQDLKTVPDKLVITEDIVEFSDAPPQNVRRLETTAGTIGQFIRHCQKI